MMQLMKKRGLYESSRVVFVPVGEITPNPAQPRRYFDKDALAELSESICRYGVIQPLTVRRRNRRFELVAGERRLRAAKLAGLSEVPCIILDVDMEESSLIALVENLQRRDLDYIEEAEGIAQLIQTYGMRQEEAARRIGKSQSAVANKLRLLKLPGEILYVLREAKLSERHARALLRLDNDEDRFKVLEHVIKKGLNVAKTEEYIDFYLADKEDEKSGHKPNSKPIYAIKDVRLFLNTISRGMDMMKQSGIAAQEVRDETETDIILTIKIPKSKG